VNTIWSPDTCDCKIEFNPQYIWIKTHRKCRLHKSLDGQLLIDEIKLQNHRFQTESLIDIDLEEAAISRQVNKERIRKENLDNFHEHLPQDHELTFFCESKKDIKESNQNMINPLMRLGWVSTNQN